jgi:hypothetical protein
LRRISENCRVCLMVIETQAFRAIRHTTNANQSLVKAWSKDRAS